MSSTTAPDHREIRKWVEAGGPLRDWPMLDVICGNCHRAARRCREEIVALVYTGALDRLFEFDSADAELGIEIRAAAIPVLEQADAVMYPAPIQGPNAPKIDDAIDFNRELAKPTCICPRCSTPAAEQQLRHECIDAGYGLVANGVFVTTPANQKRIEFPEAGKGRAHSEAGLA